MMPYIDHERSHLASLLAVAMSEKTDSPTLAGMIKSALRGTWTAAQKESEEQITKLEAEVARLQAIPRQEQLRKPVAFLFAPTNELWFPHEISNEAYAENPDYYQALFADATVAQWLTDFLDRREKDSYSCTVLVKELKRLLNANLNVRPE